MIRKFFGFIADIIRGLGVVVGSVIGFVVYALYGYFVLWVVKIFSGLMVDAEWITNEYVLSAWSFIFIEHITTTELVVVIGFGIVGIARILNGAKE